MSHDDHHNHEYHSGKGGSSGRDKPQHRGYPYQPVEYPHEPEDEIDIIELAQHFWGDRKLIAKITGVFVAIGIFIALFSGVEYKANAVLMPELQGSQSTASSLLQQYGGLLGISVSPATGGTIPPMLYPKIVESVPFNVKLMRTPITFSEYDTTVTAYHFFQDIYTPSLMGYIKKFTLGLPGLILGLFEGESSLKGGPRRTDITTMAKDTVLNLTEEQWEMVKKLRERVNVQVSEESGLVTLTATMPDPIAAAELARAGIHLLIKRVKEYQSRKAVQNLKFIRKMVQKARRKFEAAQERLAEFRDSNLSLASAQAQAREQELQTAYNLAFNLYNMLRKRLQQAKIRVQKQTPVVSILQPVTVPENESSPKRKLIVIVFLILGIIVALGWSLVRVWGREVVQEVRAGDASHSDKQPLLWKEKQE